MCIALILLAAVLLLVNFSPPPLLQDTKIELRLLADIEKPAAEPVEPEELLEPEAIIEPIEPAELVEPAELQATDWYANAESAVQETVTTANHVDSMHPDFDEKRRMAAINFPASRAVIKKPIWENVETDHIGRKVLVNGDCYRVLEDPRATYYEIHRQLGQYIMNCYANFEKPMGVVWVEDIRERYAYLKYPDGDVPQDLIDNLSRRF